MCQETNAQGDISWKWIILKRQLFQVIFWVGHEQYVFFDALYLSKDKQLASSNFAYRTRKKAAGAKSGEQ